MRSPSADLRRKGILLFEVRGRSQFLNGLHHWLARVHRRSQVIQAKQGGREHHENRGHVLLDRHETFESKDRLPALSIEGVIDDFGQSGSLLIDQAVFNVGGGYVAHLARVRDQLFSFTSRQKSRKIAARRDERGGIGVDLASEG